MNQTSNIRTQILIPLTLTFLVLFISFMLSSLAIRQDAINNTLNKEYGKSISLFKEMLFNRVEWMTAVSEGILKDPSLQLAMRQRDRKNLYKHARPYFQKLHTNGVSHLYFHEPNTKNFLRVHQPGRYGDIIARDSMLRAIKFHSPAYGIELGPFNTLTLRLVIPWQDKTGTLGFIELGTDVNDTLGDLAIINNIDYVLTLKKALMDKSHLIDAESMLERKLNWHQFPHDVILASSLNKIPLSINQQLSSNNLTIFQVHDWQKTTLSNKQFAFKTFPFRETSGREIGNFILLPD